jgi:hypothetical protein
MENKPPLLLSYKAASFVQPNDELLISQGKKLFCKFVESGDHIPYTFHCLLINLCTEVDGHDGKFAAA